jgi:biopolymer transport protein ExbB
MKYASETMVVVLAGFISAGPAMAQSTAPVSMEIAASAVRQDLETATKELTSLRESIGSEKMPMTRELSRLEDQLIEARREYDKSRRAVDARSLELNNLKADAKLRQDEVTYVGSLLDEYARTFEGRIHASEIERYKPAIESALQAPQNKDLNPAQKFDCQLAMASASFQRLEELIGGTRFAGSAVDPQGIVEDGKFALIGPVALFSTLNGQTAGLALPQAGSSKPAVHLLPEKEAGISMAGIVLTGQGMLQFDPTMGGALKELIAKGNLWGYFKRGGPIMWPLLALAILALTVLIERLVFLAIEKKRRNRDAVAEIMLALEQSDPEKAIKAGLDSKDFVARCLSYALHHREKSLSDALMRSSAQEMVRFTRGIALLDTVVTMAPLLGLLGTVTGMISAFGMLGGSELGAPTAITGGIAEALIATTFGLGIAVTALIPLNFLHARCEGARHEMEDAMSHLELLMRPLLEKQNKCYRLAVEKEQGANHAS